MFEAYSPETSEAAVPELKHLVDGSRGRFFILENVAGCLRQATNCPEDATFKAGCVGHVLEMSVIVVLSIAMLYSCSVPRASRETSCEQHPEQENSATQHG